MTELRADKTIVIMIEERIADKSVGWLVEVGRERG